MTIAEFAAPWRVAPHDELPLRILIAADAEAREAGRRWIADVNFADVNGGTGSLLPRIYLRLRALGIEHAEMRRLQGVRRFHWYRNRLQLGALRPAVVALMHRGITVAPIGSLAFALGYDPDIGAREISPLQILVAQRDAAHAGAVLDAAGWTPMGNNPPAISDALVAQRSSVVFQSRDGFALALHWRSYDWGLRPRVEIDLTQLRREIELDGAVLRQIDPAELLLLTCVQDPTREDAPPAWLADSAAIIRDAAIDWNVVVRRAHQACVGANAARGLTMIAGFGQPLPAEVIAALRRSTIDQDRLIASLHRDQAWLGPALYRRVRRICRWSPRAIPAQRAPQD